MQNKQVFTSCLKSINIRNYCKKGVPNALMPPLH